MAETIRIKRERKELIATYATAAGNLYGVLSVEEFVDVFNHYEDEKTNATEAVLALERLAKTDEVDYCVQDGLISGGDFILDFADGMENARITREYQAGKPRYLPEKEEFLRYIDYAYYEPKAPYDELKKFILDHKLTDRGEGIDGVDGDFMDLREMISFGNDIKDEMDYFTHRGYKFKNLNEVNKFGAKLVNAHNNTRCFDNNGFTPNEMQKYEKSKALIDRQGNGGESSVRKVGRNEPCPCGSGLKYKKCHGR
jgi:hypothetical protein